MSNIYVASSWRNHYQPRIVGLLRAAGHEVYDFRNPEPGNFGFQWSQIDKDWQNWTPSQLREALTHPVAVAGFRLDARALDEADMVVLVLPSGRSAHTEAAFHSGKGKPVLIYIPEPVEPELMYGLLGSIVVSEAELITALEA